MKKQVVVIHGGDAFATYEEYIDFLKNFDIEYDPQKESKKSWKRNLSEDLGDDYEIISPRMPNSYNAKYIEWKIWFEKYIPYIRDGVVFVGHSLGGIFLAKYLSEEDYPKVIRGTLLVAAPYDTDENGDRPIVEFNLPHSLEKFEKQGGSLFLYHSEDDSIVSYTELDKYRKQLPSAIVQTFTNRNHFFDEHFPELVADVKKLA